MHKLHEKQQINQKINLFEQNQKSTKDSSLPNINPNEKNRFLPIKRQVNTKNQQILLLKARLNTLSKQKEKMKSINCFNQKKLEYLKHVKDRVQHDRELRNQYKLKKKSQQSQMKKRATSIRKKLKRQKQHSLQLFHKNIEFYAQTQRQKQKQDKQYVEKLKSLQVSTKRSKVLEVKKFEQQLQQKKKQFLKSRISLGKSNRTSRIEQSLKRSRKADLTICYLRKRQSKIIDKLKNVEKDMMKSFYQIEQFNPEFAKTIFHNTKINFYRF